MRLYFEAVVILATMVWMFGFYGPWAISKPSTPDVIIAIVGFAIYIPLAYRACVGWFRSFSKMNKKESKNEG